MARLIDIHPDNPQPRAIEQAVALLRDGGLIAYPTDSGYALGCSLAHAECTERIRSIRELDDKHHFTLVCANFAQFGQYVHIDNSVFRAVKAATPGSYTFILPATREVPKKLAHAKKRTVGVRMPDHRVVTALLEALGEPLVSSTLILPGESEPMTDSWSVKEALDLQVEAVIESGEVHAEPTTVIDLSEGIADIVRRGAGDPSPFE